MTAIRALFPYPEISRFKNISWRPRSPDLTLCDFFIFGLSQRNRLQIKTTYITRNENRISKPD